MWVNRAIRISTVISAVLMSVMLVLCLAANWLEPSDHHLSLSDDFHIGVWARGWDIRLAFFSQAEGPYRGSLIGFVDDQGNIYPPLQREVYFGGTAGIYHRYFRRSFGALWTLMLSIWYPIGLFAILPLVWLVRHLRDLNHEPGHCRVCGYDLRASKDRCPECGKPIVRPSTG